MSFFYAVLKNWGKGMRTFGKDLGAVINSAILLIMYVFGIGITSVVAKVLKKKFLKLKPTKSELSYWVDLDVKKQDPDEFYKQF